jgi:aryl-alcohol dehydrogenase-like predicted oxidoreductase
MKNIDLNSMSIEALWALHEEIASVLAAKMEAERLKLKKRLEQITGKTPVGIRVLAGGALSGSAERHPIASSAPEPIGSAMTYDADLDRSRRLMPLVTEGFASSLTEAATRFALSHPAMGTILVGMATPQQFEDALAAGQKGPLPRTARDRLSALRQGFSGEPR